MYGKFCRLGSDGKALNVKLLSVEGKFVQANEYGKSSSAEEVQIELTEEENAMASQMRQVWNEILKIEIADDTDFFATGAGSMDVVRLVEEVKDKAGVEITNEDVFMATAFSDFIVSSKLPSSEKEKDLCFFLFFAVGEAAVTSFFDSIFFCE